MNSVAAAVLEPVGEGRVVLESVAIDCRVRGLLSESGITQTYRNTESVNIEAVYTFPLPLDAVLLELELTLNGETLRAQVQARAQAEAAYEDAIEDDNSAVLLESAGPGAYTLSVGNLLAGETAVIRMRYAQLHHWQGDSLRLHLPTTIAPRYGDPAAAGLAPHQQPEWALSADRGFTLCLSLEGEHAQADWECPSHTVAVESAADVTRIRLGGGSALMDRDFVLVLRETRGVSAQGMWAQDGDAVVALASFHPAFPDETPMAPRCVTLLVDCSGSMAGDSIAQARAALHQILGLLEPADRFNVIAFGSQHRSLFARPVPASEAHIAEAARFVGALDAYMGGTEIDSALRAAWAAGDVLLITDGEVWNTSHLINDARQSGSRLFTVGVGSAVSEAFVQELADASGGACELVSPNEQMAGHIVRHFRRMAQPGAASVAVRWPCSNSAQAPATFNAVYAGDTLHVVGWLSAPPSGDAVLQLTLEDGRELTTAVSFSAPDAAAGFADLPRIAAHRRLRELKQQEATALAVEYQLVTEYTSCVLVQPRQAAQAGQGVPALRKVSQLLAAGSGGFGSVADLTLDMGLQSRPSRSRRFWKKDKRRFLRKRAHKFNKRVTSIWEEDLRKSLSERMAAAIPSLAALARSLNAAFAAGECDRFDTLNLAWLSALGLDADRIDRLAPLANEDLNYDERKVVLAVLQLLMDSDQAGTLTRHVRRLIRRELKAGRPNAGLMIMVFNVMV